MLGIKFNPGEEERFERHARELRRPKSALAREWILERLDRDSVDTQIAHAAALIAANTTAAEIAERTRHSVEMLGVMDNEDGGYDWGPAGPPL